MLSENIKKLRKEKGLTQKELADLLHVTSQAVSRWENGDVEPSIDTIKDMAKIFEISVDNLLDVDNYVDNIDNTNIKETTDNIINEEKVKEIAKQVAEETAKQIEQSEQKPVLAVCDRCKKPIYESEQIISKTGRHGRSSYKYYICSDCEKKETKEKHKNAVNYGISQRKKSIGWSIFYATLVLIAGLIFITNSKEYSNYGIAPTIILPILTFTFSSCLYLKNNFIEDMFLEIASWGFVKFPGLIFSFDLDGFAWLIGMKILFWILGFVIGLLAVLLSLALCMPLSLFTYPFALKKNIQNPELTENI